MNKKKKRKKGRVVVRLTPKAKRILDRTRRRIPEFTTKAIDAAAKSLRKELEKRLREL